MFSLHVVQLLSLVAYSEKSVLFCSSLMGLEIRLLFVFIAMEFMSLAIIGC